MYLGAYKTRKTKQIHITRVGKYHTRVLNKKIYICSLIHRFYRVSRLGFLHEAHTGMKIQQNQHTRKTVTRIIRHEFDTEGMRSDWFCR